MWGHRRLQTIAATITPSPNHHPSSPSGKTESKSPPEFSICNSHHLGTASERTPSSPSVPSSASASAAFHCTVWSSSSSRAAMAAACAPACSRSDLSTIRAAARTFASSCSSRIAACATACSPSRMSACIAASRTPQSSSSSNAATAPACAAAIRPPSNPSAVTDAHLTSPSGSSSRRAMMETACSEMTDLSRAISHLSCTILALAAIAFMRTRLSLCSTPRSTTASGPAAALNDFAVRHAFATSRCDR
mmetsp:Transcript_30290/g.75862  ORF Transcript_30290/g.75862 Transcript_30290/m.75862 type:complete len:249 (+) Transcript_30290:465-1211(+)